MAETLMPCPSCGATNRVPIERVTTGTKAVCGRCKTPLATAAPVIVDDRTFADVVERSPVPVLVDMWAPWCGPCRMVSPALENLARQYAGKMKLVKVNVDESPAISRRFEVQGIPTLLLVREGEVVARQTGAAPEPTLRAWLDRGLAAT